MSSQTHLEVHLGAGSQQSSNATHWEDLAQVIGDARCQTLTSASILAWNGEAFEAATAVFAQPPKGFERLSTISLILNTDVASQVSSSSATIKQSDAESPRLSIDVLLDDSCDAFATLNGHSDSLEHVLEFSQSWLDQGVAVRWLIPAIPELVFRLEAIFSLARNANICPVITPSASIDSSKSSVDNRLNADELLFLWDFVTYRLLEDERHLLTEAQVEYYESLRDSLANNSHDFADRTVEVLEARFEPSNSETHWTARESSRTFCGTSRFDSDFETGKGLAGPKKEPISEVGSVITDGLRGLTQWLGFMTKRPMMSQKPLDAGQPLKKIIAIGAYGGEHIGDAAILGGVLQRVHNRYGATEAVLMTQRPNHTRHLVPMLDVPVKINVAEYQHAEIRKAMKDADAVVFAGGPLIDLPKQLVRHLYTASMASRMGKPFIMEGIGPGPFIRLPSKWVARRLVKMARYLSIRTSTDAERPMVRDLKREIGRCPAFDYLETRPPELPLVRDVDHQWLNQLLSDAAGRPLIAVNIRPIRDQYTEVDAGVDKFEHTQNVQTSFVDQLTDGMRRFARESDSEPCFVFFPMNAIQFGQSDLQSAYRMQSRLGSDVDFRVWEGDASLDGVVELLRRVDIAITMRFHATIFALAQGKKVIGIDYRVGKKDKIAALLDDVGQSDNCTRIDLLSAEWIKDRLDQLTHEMGILSPVVNGR